LNPLICAMHFTLAICQQTLPMPEVHIHKEPQSQPAPRPNMPKIQDRMIPEFPGRKYGI
jgi:hypothetical protein